MAARDGIEPSLTASKAAVLPLDDLAMERVMGFAPTAFSLATRRSTAELHPHFDFAQCAEGRSRTAISCFSDTRRDHLGYLGLVGGEGIEPPTSRLNLWACQDSNLEPLRCKRIALPIELQAQIFGGLL